MNNKLINQKAHFFRALFEKTPVAMRMTLLFLMLFVFTIQSEQSYSQITKISLDMKNSSIEKILQTIEHKSDFYFLYNSKLIDVDRRTDIQVDEESIASVLDQLFDSENVEYKVKGIQIILHPKEITWTTSELIVDAQQQHSKQVTGMVVDEYGEPIIGANVIEKGTTNGTVTDIDGRFSLRIDENATLRFSYIGYLDQEMLTTGINSFDIVLVEDTKALDEVIVVGYGTARKIDLTGAVTSADIESFREAPNTNILQSMQGSIPGLTIGQTEQAGAEPSISIRGQNTISGNTSPLIVVDGIIYSGRIGDLNPADIQSVNILKDPSSKAIYGAQAANGVMLITTKTGKRSEKPAINYSGSVGVHTPTVNTRFLNAEEMTEFIRDANWQDSYLAPDYTQPDPDWDFSQAMLRSRQYSGFLNGTDFDWWDTLTQTGMLTDHVLSVSGGLEKTHYYLSGGYMNQEGVQKNDNYERISARISIDTDIAEWLTIGTNSFGSFSDFSGIFPSAGSQSTSPFNSPYDEDGNLELALYGTELNPLLSYQIDNKDLRNRINGTFYAVVKIPQVEGLEYRINFGNDYTWINQFTGNEWGGGYTGSATKYYSSRFDQTLDNILSYNNKFGNHGVSATLVYGYKENQFNSTTAEGTNISNIALSYNSLQQAITQTISSSGWNEIYIYQMGRVNYNYLNTYMVTATLRRDGFSGFSRNNKFGLFPSVGLAWVLSNEPFITIPKLDYLKIRGSYGANGNLTSRYSSLARVSSGDSNAYVFGDGTTTSKGQSPSSLANNDLGWEKTAGYNFGLDFNTFNNRISGNIDYYHTFTTDLLWDVVLPRMTGFSSVRTNLGKIRNAGWEFALKTIPMQMKNFEWNLGLNFSANRNKIIKLTGERDSDGNEIDLVSSGLFIGKSLGTIYNYQIDGIWQINDNIPTGYYPGNYRIVDQNRDGTITAQDDRVFLGRTEPAYSFGIENTMRWQNFSFHFFINSIQGGKDSYLRNIGRMTSGLDNVVNSGYLKNYDGWTRSNPSAKYAMNYFAPQVNPNNYQSRSFVRLQDVSLAYQVNPAFLERIGIENMKIYISGKNLLTFTNWDGWDPESGRGFSSSLMSFPVLKTYSLGIDISL